MKPRDRNREMMTAPRIGAAGNRRTRAFLITMLLGGVGFMLACGPRVARANDTWLHSLVPFYRISTDHHAVTRQLERLRRHYPDFQQRLRAIVLLRVGTPYVLGCLGEGRGRDAKPVFRLDESDCTVNILTSAALAHASDWKQACAMMMRLNYYPTAPGVNPVHFANRIHFTSDRLLTSRYFSVLHVVPRSQEVPVTLTLNRKAGGGHLIDIPWTKRVTISYVPDRFVTRSVLARLPRYVAGVAFVRRKMFPLGVIVAHEGAIVDRHRLVEADSIRRRTISVDFLTYLHRTSDWFDGVIFFKFH